MGIRLIKVVPDGQGDLDSSTLDEAEAAVIRSKISNSPMSVSYSFLQELLAEVRRNRRTKAALSIDLDDTDVSGLHVEEFFLDDQQLVVDDSEPDQEDESSCDEDDLLDDSDDEVSEVELRTVQAPRRSTLVGKYAATSASPSVSFLRMTLVAILTIFVMTVWVVIYG